MAKYCCNCMVMLNDNEDICPKCKYRISLYHSEPHQLPPGTIVNRRYAVGKVLGEGGFGITYIGFDTTLNLVIALKEFYMSGYVNRNCTYSATVTASSGSRSEIFIKNRDKFLDEARILAKFVDDKSIVEIRDYFIDNNTAYIVMEYLSGKTLKQYIAEKKKMTWDETMNILSPILSSLVAIHNENIIHRDISPDNIMMADNGRIVLLDFGSARKYSDEDIKSRSVVLKRGYAPEEQYRTKGEQGPWSDLYSICAVIYRCITGIVPEEAIERINHDNVIPPISIGAECTKSQSSVLMKGMAVKKENRYQNISEFLQALFISKIDTDTDKILSVTINDTNDDMCFTDNNCSDDELTVLLESCNSSTSVEMNNKKIRLFDNISKNTKFENSIAEKSKFYSDQNFKEKLLLTIVAGLILLSAGELYLTRLNSDRKIVRKINVEDNYIESTSENVESYNNIDDSIAIPKSEVCINESKLMLPTSFKTLSELGWKPKNTTDYYKEISPGEKMYIILSNGKGEMYAYFDNNSSIVKTAENCPVYLLRFQKSHQKGNEIFIDEIKLGKTTEDEIVKVSFLNNFSLEKKKNVYYYRLYSDNCNPKESSEASRAYIFNFKNGVVDQIYIANMEYDELDVSN